MKISSLFCLCSDYSVSNGISMKNSEVGSFLPLVRLRTCEGTTCLMRSRISGFFEGKGSLMSRRMEGANHNLWVNLCEHVYVCCPLKSSFSEMYFVSCWSKWQKTIEFLAPHHIGEVCSSEKPQSMWKADVHRDPVSFYRETCWRFLQRLKELIIIILHT